MPISKPGDEDVSVDAKSAAELIKEMEELQIMVKKEKYRREAEIDKSVDDHLSLRESESEATKTIEELEANLASMIKGLDEDLLTNEAKARLQTIKDRLAELKSVRDGISNKALNIVENPAVMDNIEDIAREENDERDLEAGEKKFLEDFAVLVNDMLDEASEKVKKMMELETATADAYAQRQQVIHVIERVSPKFLFDSDDRSSGTPNKLFFDFSENNDAEKFRAGLSAGLKRMPMLGRREDKKEVKALIANGAIDVAESRWNEFSKIKKAYDEYATDLFEGETFMEYKSRWEKNVTAPYKALQAKMAPAVGVGLKANMLKILKDTQAQFLTENFDKDRTGTSFDGRRPGKEENQVEALIRKFMVIE